jgi:uncharacterized cupin superfamily protein
MPYRVAGSETFQVLEGSCELTAADGDVMSLRSGDSVAFSDGFEARWQTTEPFMKFFVVTGPPADPKG